jgi:hypothetical protein
VSKTHAREQVPLYMELDAMKRVEADTKEGASRWSGRGLRGTRSEAERVGARTDATNGGQELASRVSDWFERATGYVVRNVTYV